MIGIIGLWASIGHLIYYKSSAHAIGWKPHQYFQQELAFLNFANGIVGILTGLQILPINTLIVSCIFLELCGINHLMQMLIYKNNYPNNSGIIMWIDILIPLLLLMT